METVATHKRGKRDMSKKLANLPLWAQEIADRANLTMTVDEIEATLKDTDNLAKVLRTILQDQKAIKKELEEK